MSRRRTGIPPGRTGMRLTKHFLRDWNELIERVRQTGDAAILRQRIRGHDPAHSSAGGEPGYPGRGTGAHDRGASKNHQRDLSARKYAEDYLDAAKRHMGTHASLQRVADSLGVPIVKVSDHLGWRQEADRLMAAAETILADSERYGVHLDNMETGRARVEGELSRLRQVIREDGESASAVKTPESHSEPVDTQEKVEQPEPVTPAWYAGLTKHLHQDWNASSKAPSEPAFHHSTPTAIWTSSRVSGN